MKSLKLKDYRTVVDGIGARKIRRTRGRAQIPETGII